MSLRQKIENHFRNRSGQGSLVGVIVATVMLSTIVAAGTEWYLSMRKNIGNTEEKLEAQTIAMSEWERLSHMSLDELEASRETLKKPYAAGQFTVSVNLGQKGTFNNGTCGAITGGYANCFKDTTITVSRDGSRLFTTRTLPLMAGDYTRREIDAKLAALDSKIANNTNAINSINGRLNGKEFIKNRTPNYDLNLRYEKKAGDDTFKLHAYNGNTEIPLASQGSSVIGLPDYSTGILFDYNTENTNQSYTMPDDGWFYFYIFAYVLPYNGCIRVNGHIVYSSAGSTVEAANDITGVIPVSKGDIITVKSYYPSYTTYTFDGHGFMVDGRGLTQLIFFKNKS